MLAGNGNLLRGVRKIRHNLRYSLHPFARSQQSESTLHLKMTFSSSSSEQRDRQRQSETMHAEPRRSFQEEMGISCVGSGKSATTRATVYTRSPARNRVNRFAPKMTFSSSSSQPSATGERIGNDARRAQALLSRKAIGGIEVPPVSWVG